MDSNSTSTVQNSQETSVESNRGNETTTEKSSSKNAAKTTTANTHSAVSSEQTTTVTTPAQATKAPQKTTAAQITTTKKIITTTSTANSAVNCTVEIECKKILNNMDKLKSGHEDFIPPNGLIMSTCSVTVDSGSSAYDAVKAACSKNNVTINAKNSAYGTYIAGFNNIDEMDCGRQSGWIYSVNGKTPSKSCDKYTVSSGDSIVFSFTC